MEDGKARERVRSPNYPAFGLGAAIERVASLYRQIGKASVQTGAAVMAWGYNTLNGRSLGVLGALRQYGLLEDTGQKAVRLSQLALTIQLAPSGSPERARALVEAATRPKVFAELFEQYKDGFPPADTMVRNLTLSTNFTEEAATRVISAFRDTIDLLEQQGIRDITRDPSEDIPNGEREERPPTEEKRRKSEPDLPQAARESLDLPLPLIGGGQAVLRVPRTMTEQEFLMLTSLINSMLAGMKPALVAAPAASNVDVDVP